MGKKLYVGNLNYGTTEAALSELFATVGEVSSVELIIDRMTGRSKGFAFVEMADQSAAAKAIEQLNGHELEGRPLRVAEARPRRDDRPGDRWGDRGSGGGRRRQQQW